MDIDIDIDTIGSSVNAKYRYAMTFCKVWLEAV